MDSPTERMPIACVHCAKAKAKCDKKVPCSRCVSKQIVCLSRATRRSSQNPSRRGQLPRAQSERTLHTSAAFHVSQLSQFSMPSTTQDLPILSPNSLSPHHSHRHSIGDISHQVPIAPAVFGPELDANLLRSGYSQTPPDMSMPITPMVPNMPHMNQFIPLGGAAYDPEGDNRFLHMGNIHSGLLEYNESMLPDFMSSPSILQDLNEVLLVNGGGVMPSANHMSTLSDGSARMPSRLDLGSPPHHVAQRMRSGPSPSSSTSSTSGLQEPDAVLALHPLWPYFQCQRVDKSSSILPKTASVYLEGLAQTLRNHSNWQAWASQLDDRQLDISFERRISTEPIVGWSREKLLAITQGFLHRALEIHKVNQHSNYDSPTSPDSPHETFLMLPPPEVMQFFLRSYVVRYEPYYSSIPGGRLDPNSLMHSSNSKAASLLTLLMVASGASATPTPEGRYVASGLTEACRVSLFDTVEKDVSQAREVLVLRSALLLICLAAWSGDKWHMDMAMGQRGLYLAMLAHAGLLDVSESRIDVNECKLDAEMAWGDWKEHEGRHRLAHSWVIVDQEISLFSDTTPQLSVVDLHVPMPDSDDLWHASSASEWLALFETTHGSTYRSPASVRDFFTRFVDGGLAGKELSPTQLRLLLHPLQAQVCQLRQFIACLPDGSAHSRGSRAVSKAATKLRLEEISTLLQQWYAISKQSFSGNQGTCWTTCANLIMYHLITLNTITSFKCIEQFVRREVPVGQQRYNNWLQTKGIDHPEEALFHCGQVLRLIRSMPKPVRPPWWAGAVYRVALISWATAMSRGGSPFSPDAAASAHFAIDDVTPESDPIERFVKHQDGEPMFTGADGSMKPVHVPLNVLMVCADVLEEDSSMRLSDGIRRKLRMFADAWGDG